MGQVKRLDTDISHLRSTNQIPEGYKMDAFVFPDKSSMGSSLNDNRVIGEQHERNKGFIYSVGRNIYRVIVKRYTAMASTKMIMFFADLFGVPIFSFVAWLNFGEFKGYMLFFVAFVYGCAKVYFYIDEQRDKGRNRKLNLKVKEHDVEEELSDDNNS